MSKSTAKKQPKKPAPPTNHIISQSRFIQHTGPIPHPEIMAHYSQIIENGAERIMRMAEEEQNHRHKIEEKAIQAEIESEQQSQKLAKKAQWFAFGVCVLAFVCAVIVALSGSPVSGALLASATLAAIVTAFLKSGDRGKNNNAPVKN